MVPPDVIDKMTQGYKSIVTGAQVARGLNRLCFRKRYTPPPRSVYDGIAGGSYTPEDDLIPMDPYHP